MRARLSTLARIGEYHLEHRLGMGGMAEVYVARREGPHGFSKRVAVKRILPQLASDIRLVEMFCDEARIQAALSHPNLVQVFDFGEDAGQPYMVLEFVDGLSGAQLIARMAARRRGIDLGPAIYVVREVLEALAYVHAAVDESGRSLGIVHRDVAPSNILIGCMGEVKLGDFGIVRSAAIDARTVPGELKGKVGYVSPEQALGLPVDPRSDLFSVGVVLAELLIGGPLFAGQNELEVLESLHRGDLGRLDAAAPAVPDDVCGVLERALARWPEQRFQTAAEFGHALGELARQHRVLTDAHGLAEWLADAGLVAVQSEVREKPAPSRAAVDELLDRSDRWSDAPFAEQVTLVAEETEGPAESLANALMALLPENDTSSIPRELAHAVSRPVRQVPVIEPPRYQVRRDNGAVLGPVRLERLLELVATGRLEASVQVARGQGPFLTIGAVTELTRLGSRAAYRFADQGSLQTPERGPARLEVLPWLIHGILDRRRTGLLVARRPSQQVRIYFEDGAPVYSSSNDPKHLLGARLVAQHSIAPHLFADALEEGWRAGRRVGEALVRRGLVSEAAVERELGAQLEARLEALFQFREGEVLFVEGARSGEAPVRVAPRAILSRALLAAVGTDELESLLAPLGAAGALSGTERAGEVLRDSDLSPELALVISKVGARSTLGELSHLVTIELGLPRSLLLRAIFLGMASGALRWVQ
jgi:serine/threonine protein kinase